MARDKAMDAQESRKSHLTNSIICINYNYLSELYLLCPYRVSLHNHSFLEENAYALSISRTYTYKQRPAAYMYLIMLRWNEITCIIIIY